MHLIKSVAILFIYIFAFAFETTLATESGYIVHELDIIPCLEPTKSVVSESCVGSIDYKIPDISKAPNGTQIQSIFDLAKSLIPFATVYFKILGNQQCSEAGTKYLCEAAHPLRCEEDYIRIDTKEMTATCSQARESCSAMNATLRDQLFDCSGIERQYGDIPKIPQKLTCVDFLALKGDPDTCDANYKVVSFNATDLSTTAQAIVVSHKALESSTADKECKEKGAEAICKAALPACSSDHTKIIALLSKEKCREMVACVNKTNNPMLIMQAHEMCNGLPSDKTATKYPLGDVYQAKGVPTKQAKITKPKESSEIPRSHRTSENIANVTSEPNLEPTANFTTKSKAEQLNTASNGLALLVISIISIFMS